MSTSDDTAPVTEQEIPEALDAFLADDACPAVIGPVDEGCYDSEDLRGDWLEVLSLVLSDPKARETLAPLIGHGECVPRVAIEGVIHNEEYHVGGAWGGYGEPVVLVRNVAEAMGDDYGRTAQDRTSDYAANYAEAVDAADLAEQRAERAEERAELVEARERLVLERAERAEEALRETLVREAETQRRHDAWRDDVEGRLRRAEDELAERDGQIGVLEAHVAILRAAVGLAQEYVLDDRDALAASLVQRGWYEWAVREALPAQEGEQ